MAALGWTVSAARRNAGSLPEQFDRYQVDLTDPASMAALSVRDPDYVLVTPTPQSYDPQGYHRGFTEAAELLAAQPWLLACRRVIWVSSTRVYREAEGGWVDKAGIHEVDNSIKYLWSVYWAITVLSTVGYGDIVAHTNAEKGFSIVAELLRVT